MRCLLDASACIALLNRSDAGLEARVRRQRVADVGLPAPVAYELYYGAFKSRRSDDYRSSPDHRRSRNTCQGTIHTPSAVRRGRDSLQTTTACRGRCSPA